MVGNGQGRASLCSCCQNKLMAVLMQILDISSVPANASQRDREDVIRAREESVAHEAFLAACDRFGLVSLESH
jgi:hypothetical protein